MWLCETSVHIYSIEQCGVCTFTCMYIHTYVLLYIRTYITCLQGDENFPVKYSSIASKVRLGVLLLLNNTCTYAHGIVEIMINFVQNTF